jgi:hypothetical protein
MAAATAQSKLGALRYFARQEGGALAAGAVLTDKYGPLEFLAKRAIASGDPKRVLAGQAKLYDIAKCRAMRQVQATG